MNVKTALVAVTVAAAPLAVPAPAYAETAEGLSRSLASGVLQGGPAVLTGGVGVGVSYYCPTA